MEAIELVILVGIQASGKTTYYRRRLEGEYLHVSLDNWRGKGNVRGKEREAILAGLASAAESGGRLRGVAVDNTSTTAQTRRRYFDMAGEFTAATGKPVSLTAYFFDADLASCLKRNAQRPTDAPAGVPYFVPPAVIAGFRSRLQPPRYEEGFARIRRVRITDDGGFAVEDVPRP